MTKLEQRHAKAPKHVDLNNKRERRQPTLSPITVTTNLNLSSPARPLVVSSSGNRSRGAVPAVEQYLLRVSPIAAEPDASWTSMNPRAQHTNPVEPSNWG